MFTFFENLISPFSQRQLTAPHDSTVQFILHYARQVPWVFAGVLLFGGLQAWIEISLFGFIGNVVDLLDGANAEVVFSEHWSTFVWMVFFVGVIRVVVMSLGTLLMELTISPSFYNLVRWQAHKNVVRQSIGFFQNDFAGRIATKVVLAGMAVSDFLITLLDTVWLILLYVISTLFLFTALDWRLTAVLLVWLAVYTVILVCYVPRVRDTARQVADAKSVLTGRLVDCYSNISLIKIDSRADREDAFVANGMQRLIDNVRLFGRAVATLRIAVVVSNSFMLLGVGYVTLMLWQRGIVSVGEVAFAMGLVLRLNLLANRFLGQINGLFRNYGQAQDSMRTVANPIAMTDDSEASDLVVSNGQVEFDNIRFNYNQGKDASASAVISGLSLSISPGEKIGLVGPSGAGKSTLVNLLLRLFDPENGAIKIDGQRITDVTQESLRGAIGMVTQDTSLLHRSIRENIAFARPDATESEIIAAAKKARAMVFIENLCDDKGRRGLDAYVGERGVKLSGGQRQRIAIARVLLKDAPILVLDEATSALDSEVEAEIQASLHDLMRGKTVIAIAHRLSTIAAMDRLIVMEEGSIVESGTHDELVRNGKRYAALWNRQSGGFIDSRAKESGSAS